METDIINRADQGEKNVLRGREAGEGSQRSNAQLNVKQTDETLRINIEN